MIKEPRIRGEKNKGLDKPFINNREKNILMMYKTKKKEKKIKDPLIKPKIKNLLFAMEETIIR